MDGLLRGGGEGGGPHEWVGHLCADVVEGAGGRCGVGEVDSVRGGGKFSRLLSVC